MLARTLLLLPLVVALSLAGCGQKEEADGPSSAPAPGVRPAAPVVEGPLAEGDPVAEADRFIQQQKIDTSKPGWKTRLPKPPVFGFPKGKKVYWVLDTNKGRISAKLWPRGGAPPRVERDLPVAPGLLRGAQVPPRDPGLHGAGR